jgi:restriction system protein
MVSDDSPEWWLEQLQTSDDVLDENVNTVQSRDEGEIRALLRLLLVHSEPFGLLDRIHLESLLRRLRHPDNAPLGDLHREHTRRLLMYAAGKMSAPWEGITWVLDCLPHRSAYALNSVGAYVFAHAQDLPDGALIRLQDAQAIIRAYYIGLPGSQPERLNLLRTLDPRSFECVIYQLYIEMGYETTFTKSRGDGGRDLIASRHDATRSEDLRVECKRWAKPVPVSVPRQLLGVVSSEGANKGVVVSTSTFTQGAREFAMQYPRIELIPGDKLVQLLNEHVGSRWPVHIDKLAAGPSSLGSDVDRTDRGVSQRSVRPRSAGGAGRGIVGEPDRAWVC